MTDFIEKLTNDITSAMRDVSKDWAEYNAIITLATVLPNTRIIERESSLKLNLIMLMIGPSGIKKSLPMTSFTLPIIKKAGELLGRDFLLPSRSSVEGLIEHLKTEKDGKFLYNEGVVIRDEFSGVFKGARQSGWQSNSLEFISEMYDGIFQKRVTTSHGLSMVDNLYGCLISCSTYYFISQMDPEFFTQGTGNRFLYCHYGIEDYEIQDEDATDYFSEGWGRNRTETIEKYSEMLEKLYKQDLQNIYVGEEAGENWVAYKKKCETIWKEGGMKDPLGWEYYPIKRYPELALKLSGLYAVSEYIDSIPRMTLVDFENFSISEEHMNKAISLVERNRIHFQKIIEIKRKYLPREKPKSDEEKARIMLQFLESSPDRMLPTNEWLDRVPIGNRNQKFELKKFCIAKGWVEVLGYKDVSQEIRDKFNMSPRSELCKYKEGL